MKREIFGLAILPALAATLCVASPSEADRSGEPVENRPASVRSGFAYGIGKHEAVLVGFVNAQGSSTTAYFQVGRTKAYGRRFPMGQPERFYSGFHRSEVEQGVIGLRPGRTYHFRLVATNAGGISYGEDETFKTQPR